MTGEPPTVDGPKAPDPLVGTVLADRYRIEKQIGEGGMGTVYLARHILLEKVVALKVLHDEYARRRELVERFLHEARAASRIRHEHVIDITDFGETATKNVFFAMEYLEGHELATELDRSGTLPWPRIKKIMLQLCSALQAAHEAGVIHRDLKPENIFLIEKFGNPEFVKVLDFGVAKLTEFEDKTRRLTRTGMVFGTPEYMSPEQARGDKPDTRVDVYACGCILYEMVTGQVPFTGDSFMGVLTKQLFDPIPRVAERVGRTDLPPGLQAVLDEALAKNREERFSSMNELAVAIDTLDNLAGVVYAAPGATPGDLGPRKTTPRPAPSPVLAPMPANATVRMSVAPVALTPAQRPATTEQDRAATIPWTPPPPPAAPPPIAVAPVAVPAPAPPPPRPSPGLTPAPASFGDMGIQFDDDTASLRLPVNKRRRLIIGGGIVAAVAAVAIIAVATSGGKTAEVAVAPPTPAPTQPAAAPAPAPTPAPTPVAVVAPADAQPVAPVAVAPPPDAQPIAVAPPLPPVAVVKAPVVVAPPDAAPVAVRPPPPPVAVAAAPQHPAPAPAPAKVAASAPPPSANTDAPPVEHKKPKKRTASAGLPAPPPPETFPPTEPKAEKKPKAPPAAKPKSDLKDPFAD